LVSGSLAYRVVVGEDAVGRVLADCGDGQADFRACSCRVREI
jgi:hypothetical protein